MSGKNAIRAAITFLALIALLGWAGVAYLTNWSAGARGGKNSPLVRIEVKPGSSVASIARELEMRGVIRSARAFTWRARGFTIRPGVYDLAASETPGEILQKLVRGEMATNRVTFPEGFTLKQIAARLEDKKLIPDQERFLKLVSEQGNTLHTMSFVPPRNLEGYLFPDTYKIPVGDSDAKIAQRLLDNFEKRVAGKVRGSSPRPLEDIVIIASLIEREAQVEKDRPKIAAVIYNRLNRNMPLQIDATVQYARGEHKSRLLFSDLTIDSPYNTYRRVGLPPGPICNPGLASIEAALAPETSDYLYYVARPDGSHLFGRTLAEHNLNIQRARREAAQTKRS